MFSAVTSTTSSSIKLSIIMWTQTPGMSLSMEELTCILRYSLTVSMHGEKVATESMIGETEA